MEWSGHPNPTHSVVGLPWLLVMLMQAHDDEDPDEPALSKKQAAKVRDGVLHPVEGGRDKISLTLNVAPALLTMLSCRSSPLPLPDVVSGAGSDAARPGKGSGREPRTGRQGEGLGPPLDDEVCGVTRGTKDYGFQYPFELMPPNHPGGQA